MTVDIADDDPRELARWGLDSAGVLHDHWVQDGVAYLNFWDDGTVMLDISNPARPSQIGKVRANSGRSGDNDHYVTVNSASSVIGIGGERLGSPTNLGVELWDSSDKRNTEFLAEIQPPAEPADENRTSHNFDIQGDYLYTPWYRGGSRVHDISDPTTPEQVTRWRADGSSLWTAEVAVPGETVIAAVTASV